MTEKPDDLSVKRVYLTCAETAKLVRAALKETFPGVKFSVRSKTYAGGASIRVGWDDGPSEHAVKAVTDRYQGAGFNAMEDLKEYKTPDLRSNGDGRIEEVHYGADYINGDRRISHDVRAEILCEISMAAGYDVEEGERVPVYCDESGNLIPLHGSTEWVQDLLYRASVRRAAYPADPQGMGEA